jgi:GNAT superfamily N-acetyltransferase
MSKRRKQGKGRSRRKVAPIPRISAERLRSGWSGPNGTRVRLAASGESADVARFMAMAGSAFDTDLAAAIDNDTIATAVLAALNGDRRAILAEFAALSAGEDPTPREAALTTVLVAANRVGELVGAFGAYPPLAAISQGLVAGIQPELMLASGALIVRFSGLGVDEPARGAGIGNALMRGAIRLYDQLGYQIAYGQIPPGRGLEHYYRRFGFEVLGVGEPLSLEKYLGIPMGLVADTEERFIVRWVGPRSTGGSRVQRG